VIKGEQNYLAFWQVRGGIDSLDVHEYTKIGKNIGIKNHNLETINCPGNHPGMVLPYREEKKREEKRRKEKRREEIT